MEKSLLDEKLKSVKNILNNEKLRLEKEKLSIETKRENWQLIFLGIGLSLIGNCITSIVHEAFQMNNELSHYYNYYVWLILIFFVLNIYFIKRIISKLKKFEKHKEVSIEFINKNITELKNIEIKLNKL